MIMILYLFYIKSFQRLSTLTEGCHFSDITVGSVLPCLAQPQTGWLVFCWTCLEYAADCECRDPICFSLMFCMSQPAELKFIFNISRQEDSSTLQALSFGNRHVLQHMILFIHSCHIYNPEWTSWVCFAGGRMVLILNWNALNVRFQLRRKLFTV